MIQVYLYWTFFTVAALGAVAAFALYIFRTWTTRLLEYIGELPPKLALEVIQTGSAIIGICASFAPPTEKSKWLFPVLAGVFCLAIGKLLATLIDARLRAEANRARDATDILTRSSFAFRDLVEQKIKRILSIAGRGLKRPSIQNVREALTPQSHLDDLLWRVAAVLREQSNLQKRGQLEPNIRIGVYISKGGQMTPVHGLSYKNRGANPFDSFETHKQHYTIDSGAAPTVIVRCCMEKRTILIDDCKKESLKKDPIFFYTHDEQKQYLKSLMCYYMGSIVIDDGTEVEAVISLDSDFANFFQNSKGGVLENLMQDLATRVRLELGLQALLKE